MNREERRAMSRLIDEFGADILVNLKPPVSRTPRERMALRQDITTQVESCRACSLCDTQLDNDVHGVDFPSLSGPCDLTVLTAFTPERQHLRMLVAAISDWVKLDRVAFVSVTACVPRAEGGTMRAASDMERTACSHNLQQAMNAAGAPNVLIVGEKALRSWRKDLKLGQLNGIVGVWQNQWMVTTVTHPATVVQTSEKKGWIAETSLAVHRLMNEIVGGIGDRCIHTDCIKPFEAWDQDALPWCNDHFTIRKPPPVATFNNERLW
jgi:hypothetical protein